MKKELSLITGAESKELSAVEMTRSCAVDLTKQINSASEDLAGMLKRAHDEKAWQALEYPDWKSYVAAELKFSKQRSFQLIDFATIRQELEKSTIVDSEALPTAEGVTRELKKVDPDQRPAVYAAAVEAAGGQQPTARQVEAAVIEIMPPEVKQAEAKVIEGKVVYNNRRELTPAMQHAHKIVDMLAQLSGYEITERKRAFSYIVKSMVLHSQMSYWKRDQIYKETGL